MMRWFGKHWGAPICDDTAHVLTPTNVFCGWCEETISPTDNGVLLPLIDSDRMVEVPYHIECFMRQVVGSTNHILQRCSCYNPGSDLRDTDPPELSKREAARLAVELWAQAKG